MPSPFESLIAANLDALYAQFGLSGIYTAPDGTATAGITIRVHRNDFRQVEGQSRAAGEMQTGEVMVRQSELAKPVKGGRFAVEGVEVWSIETTPALKNGQFVCTCVRLGNDRLMERRQKDHG